MRTDLATEATLWAMRVGNEHFTPADALTRLRQGIASFGWSYVPTADLKLLQERVAKNGWDSLEQEERNCYMAFLLDVKPGDWVIFPNTPERSKFALALVTGSYFFEWDGQLEDFCHHFSVDPQSLKVIDKQDAAVPSLLRVSRLNLPQRAYRILDRTAFEELIGNVFAGKIGQPPIDPAGNLAQFEFGIEQHCAGITRELQRQYPRATLESLFVELFRAMPGVRNVTHTAGPSEQGADLLVEYGGLPGITPEVAAPQLLVVQVKSYTGTHLEPRAIDQVQVALNKYRADAALIISTADEPAPAFLEGLEKAQQATEKPIGLLIGANLGKFVMGYLPGLRGIQKSGRH